MDVVKGCLAPAGGKIIRSVVIAAESSLRFLMGHGSDRSDGSSQWPGSEILTRPTRQHTVFYLLLGHSTLNFSPNMRYKSFNDNVNLFPVNEPTQQFKSSWIHVPGIQFKSWGVLWCDIDKKIKINLKHLLYHSSHFKIMFKQFEITYLNCVSSNKMVFLLNWPQK